MAKKPTSQVSAVSFYKSIDNASKVDSKKKMRVKKIKSANVQQFLKSSEENLGLVSKSSNLDAKSLDVVPKLVKINDGLNVEKKKKKKVIVPSKKVENGNLEEISKSEPEVINGFSSIVKNTEKLKKKEKSKIESKDKFLAPKTTVKVKNGKITKLKKKSKSLKSFSGHDSSFEMMPELEKDDETFTDLLSKIDQIDDVRDKAKAIMSHLLKPFGVETFFDVYFQKKHLHIKRNDANYIKGLLSVSDFDAALREQYIEYTKNLDVTSYTDFQRETHNPEGRAYPPVVWDYFNNGCSLRLLNPQTFFEPVFKLLSSLQCFFGDFIGANTYLTPSGTQGFAPHWDDIEAFIVQLEGKKRWRVYSPKELLPIHSSGNLTQDEIGEPILDTILEAGDLLYLPRGFIHQGEALETDHSFHITLSCYQTNSWKDLITKMFSEDNILSIANSQLDLRKALPRDYLEYMGTFNKKSGNQELRSKFKNQLASLIVENMISDDFVDKSADLMARKFIHESLPQFLPEEVKKSTILKGGSKWVDGEVDEKVPIESDSSIRLLDPSTIRISLVNGEWKLSYSIDNSKVFKERLEQFIILDDTHLPAMKLMVKNYPKFTKVQDLPSMEEEEKITLAMALWENCLIQTSN